MPNAIHFNRWSLFVAMMVTAALLYAARLPISASPATFWTMCFPITSIVFGLYCQHRGYHIGFERVIKGLECLGLMAAACLIAGVSTYPVLSFTTGWRDAYLVKADVIIGFDWFQLFTAVKEHPLLCYAVEFAYGSILFQSTIIIILLSIFKKFDHIHRFISANIIALFITVFLVYFFPAKSAAIEFLGEGFSGLTPSSSAHVPIINSLREGHHPPLDLAKLIGLITFPSFHASASILYAWAALPIRFARTPLLILNVLMLFSSLVLGGHYLIDVIGGTIVALLSIKLAQLMPRSDLVPAKPYPLLRPEFVSLNAG